MRASVVQLSTFLKISPPVFCRKMKLIQVWNDIIFMFNFSFYASMVE